MSIVKITPIDEKIVCTAGNSCVAKFSASNTAGRPLSCGVQIKSQDNAEEWIEIEGTIERRIEEGMDATIELKISPPADIINEENSPKIYAFYVRVYDANQPEEIVDSPTVSISVNALKSNNKKPFPWLWGLAVIPALLIVGLVFWLLQSPSGEQHSFANAQQISNHPSGHGAADKAIDGDTSGQWQDNGNNTLSGTNGKADFEWWQGDLGKSRDIGKVVLHFRTDCCDRWKKNFHIFVANEKISSSSLNVTSAKNQAQAYFHYNVQTPSEVYTWQTPDNTSGRYVMVMTSPEAKQALNAEITKLAKEISAINQQITAINAKVKQMNAQISVLNAQIRFLPHLKSNLQVFKNTIQNLEKQKAALQQQSVALGKTRSAFESEAANSFLSLAEVQAFSP